MKKLPLILLINAIGILTACNQTHEKIHADDVLAGCYTVGYHEPAQIKINHQRSDNHDSYTMQMRIFNNPNQAWDTPTPLELLANDSPEIQQYFDIKSGESQYLEKVIARPDRIFVLGKITDGFANLNPQFDSSYLGFIYKGSNTIYKVACEKNKQ
ncbi:hypothetical protein MOMA_00915 [Moraxella macacae 0408225]|uniref:Lipoprotein n=1 Tax=Moraxella macacae 0408225 TaxID=1230338 RepID=L2F8Y0_9GAMM|nr:hypothetical protein [Moraxella macacae]ELA08928.1 hypothetical protein MOMA_00915 [Moraxella macacae 0408225]